VHSILLQGRYNKVNVKTPFHIQMKNASIQSPATELTAFYLENKNHALMG